MKLGFMVGYSGAKMGGAIAQMKDADKMGFATHNGLPIGKVQEAERLGYDSVWTAEAWGSDAVTPLAWIGAHTSKIKLGTSIMQIPGRSPANTAMTAMTLDELSGGRFMLGLGTSGPQVVEGWHGQPFDKTLTWVREYVTIVRKIIERKEPLVFHGEKYRIPYDGPGSTGQGKPLKSILHGNPNIPIYVGALAQKAQAQAGELCDGLLLTTFNPYDSRYVEKNLTEGFAKSAKPRGWENFDIAVTVSVVIDDDLERARVPLKQQLGFYIGGMGSKKQNFYKDFLARSGFEGECEKIQDLWFAGDREGAIRGVTDEMVDAIYLVGSRDRIKDRFQAWKSSKVGTFIVGSMDLDVIRFVAELNAA
ncbi:MAG: LLM class F420-dependent oxidoreductase [Polyangiales bacterium]